MVSFKGYMKQFGSSLYYYFLYLFLLTGQRPRESFVELEHLVQVETRF